jgi:hypothetical protein
LGLQQLLIFLCYAIPITTGKKDTVVWPSFVAPFQLPLLRCSNYDRKKKQLSVRCYAVPNTTGKEIKNLAGAQSLLRPEKKSSSRLSGGCMIVITTGKKSSSCLLGPARSNYDRKKKIQLSVHCYAVPNTTEKKKKSGGCAIVITTDKKKF